MGAVVCERVLELTRCVVYAGIKILLEAENKATESVQQARRGKQFSQQLCSGGFNGRLGCTPVLAHEGDLRD